MPKNKAKLNEKIKYYLPLSSKKQKALYESAGAVASTSQSGSQSTQVTSNAVATSAAAKLLKDVVDQIDLTSDVSGDVETEVADYIGRIEHHPQYGLPADLDRVSLSIDERQLASYAALCAINVHNAQQSEMRISLSSGSIDGSAKSYGIYKQCWKNGTLLIISFTATRKRVEWMANVNADSVASKELGEEYLVHKGFAEIAKKTQHSLSLELERHLRSMPAPISILFTGHSAGGAIAQLLFGFMTSNASVLSNLQSSKRVPTIHARSSAYRFVTRREYKFDKLYYVWQPTYI
ncbi:hypothetical protein P171DRAFT_525372, partial [Karstenula rhodostoma CBS 690.94]